MAGHPHHSNRTRPRRFGEQFLQNLPRITAGKQIRGVDHDPELKAAGYSQATQEIVPAVGTWSFKTVVCDGSVSDLGDCDFDAVDGEKIVIDQFGLEIPVIVKTAVSQGTVQDVGLHL